MSIQSECGGLTVREKVGGSITLLGGLLGTIGTVNFFMQSYHSVIQANLDIKNLGGAKMLTGVFPAMNDLGVLAGVAFLVASYGFFAKKRWAWLVAILAATAGLLSSWMGIVFPLMVQQTPKFALIFLPDLVLWLILVLYVRPTKLKIAATSLIYGIAFVLNFMNGVAAMKMMLGTHKPIFFATQQLNWLAAICFGIFSIAILFRKSWGVPVAVAGGLLAAIGGLPLSRLNAGDADGASLFFIGPTVALVLTLALIIWGNKLWVGKENKAAQVTNQQDTPV